MTWLQNVRRMTRAPLAPRLVFAHSVVRSHWPSAQPASRRGATYPNQCDNKAGIEREGASRPSDLGELLCECDGRMLMVCKRKRVRGVGRHKTVCQCTGSG